MTIFLAGQKVKTQKDKKTKPFFVEYFQNKILHNCYENLFVVVQYSVKSIQKIYLTAPCYLLYIFYIFIMGI